MLCRYSSVFWGCDVLNAGVRFGKNNGPILRGTVRRQRVEFNLVGRALQVGTVSPVVIVTGCKMKSGMLVWILISTVNVLLKETFSERDYDIQVLDHTAHWRSKLWLHDTVGYLGWILTIGLIDTGL